MRNDVGVSPARIERAQYDSAQIEALLYAAGRTLMALRVQGCWPGGYRSGMPECLRDPEDLKYAEAEYTPPQPSPSQVSAMDRALSWIKLLPGRTEAEIRLRKLVWARCLVSPKNDRPLYSWRRLGAQLGISHVHAKTLWLRAVTDITVALNRPGFCVAAGGAIGPGRRPVLRMIQGAATRPENARIGAHRELVPVPA